MAQRGRPSFAALAIARDNISSLKRPSPPDVLTAEESNAWVEIVNRVPAEWFPAETHPMLIQYCRHIVRSNEVRVMIQREIDKGPNMNLSNYMDLSRIEVLQSNSLSSLATRMRLTQQSSHDYKKRKPIQGDQKLQLLEIAKD